MDEIPRGSSGVYQILCRPNGKIYVGSAIDLRVRWEQHRRSLQRADHRNRHLQNAWDRYGGDEFAFSVLEYVPARDLLSAEQVWIDRTRCTDRNVGFNIYGEAGSPGERNARAWKGFVTPDGEEIEIFNLTRFCREHDLDFPSMHRLAQGTSKLKSYKGWTHRNSVRRRAYVKTYDGFITPAGIPAGRIVNLAAFCKKRGLDSTHMVAVAKGKSYSHRGWTYNNVRQRQTVVHKGFVSPDGETVVITNLIGFCRANRLCVAHMHELKSGKRRSHKGWTWRVSDE